MEFRHYDSDKLIRILNERNIYPELYRVCSGCVFTNVPPEDCFHRHDEFEAPSLQSDTFCPHCVDTIEKSQERFHLSLDTDITSKVTELTEILELLNGRI